MAGQLFKIARDASTPAIALAFRFDKKEVVDTALEERITAAKLLPPRLEKKEVMDTELEERIKNLEKIILQQGDEISELKYALSDSVDRMKALESEKAQESVMIKSATIGGDKSRSSSRKIQNGTPENEKKEGHIPAWKPPGSAMAKSNTLK